MPGYRTHIIAGAALCGAALYGAHHFGYYTPTQQEMALLPATAVLGALLPDIDTDSIGQRLFYALFFLVAGWLILQEQYKWAAIAGLAAMLPAMSPHRGFTHRWWAVPLFGLPILVGPHLIYGTPFMVMLPWCAAFCLGYISHLALDREY